MLIDPTTPLTLAETMGAVFAAIIEAQQQAARATVEFINDVGFGPSGPAPDKPLLTTTFRFTKLDENRLPAPFELEVPLLAMVDIPLIAVRKATVAFAYEVTQTDTPPSPSQSTPTTGGAALTAVKPALIKGRLVKRSTGAATAGDAAARRDQSASIEVTVELEKAPPPVGLDRLLDLLEVGMTERRVNATNG